MTQLFNLLTPSSLAHFIWFFHFSQNCAVCCAQPLGHIRLFATPWTVAYQAHLSMGIFQEIIKNIGEGCHALLQEIFPSKDRTQVSHIADGFFTI